MQLFTMDMGSGPFRNDWALNLDLIFLSCLKAHVGANILCGISLMLRKTKG